MTPLRSLWPLLLVAACTIDAPRFHTGDAGVPDAAVDAPPEGPAIVLSETRLDLDEGTAGSFTVRLDRAPGEALGLTVSVSDADRLVVTPNTLVFDDTDWDQPLEILVTARPDDDVADEVLVVRIAGEGAGPEATVAVYVTDDDVLALLVSPEAALDVSEGATATMQVRLSHRPAAAVAVAVTSADPQIATVDPASLLFDATTWSTPQLVTVAGVDDADTVSETTSVTFTAPGVAPVTRTVHVTDDDILGIVVSTTNLGTLDEGASTSFTVALTQQPPGPVTVAVASSDPSALTVSPTSLGFTTGSWSTPQTVTVVAPQDVDHADENVTITLSAAGLDSRAVAVLVIDDDVQAILLEPTALTLTEGLTGQLHVRLAYAPAGPTTVTLASLNGAVASVSPPSLSFGPGTYAVAQPVTITALQDDDLVDGQATIRAQIAAQGLSADAQITVLDDDEQRVIATISNPVIPEGTSRALSVRLGFQPAGNVTVQIASSDPGRATVSPTSLTFGPTDWSTAKSTTISIAHDDDVADDEVTITASAPGAAPGIVTITIDDDDTQEILLSQSALTLTEGTSDTIGVRLRYRPAATQQVTIVSMDPDAVSAPASLAFTPSNWNVSQPVEISALHDDDLAWETVVVRFSSPDTLGKDLTVTVMDDDSLHAVFSVESLEIVERTWGGAGIRLSHPISSDVTLQVYTSNSWIATTSVDQLTFTPANWFMNQWVDVIPVIDDNADDEELNLVVRSSQPSILNLLPMRILDVTGYAGHAGPFTGQASFAPGQLVAVPFTTPAEVYVEKLAVDLPFYPAGQEVMIAIYDDAAGRPGSVYLVTGPVAITDAHVTIPLPNPSYMPAGTTRWVAVMSAGTITIRADTAPTSVQCVASVGFAGGMPSTFPTGAPCTTAPPIQAYGVGYTPWF
jgi:hypothetical protein